MTKREEIAQEIERLSGCLSRANDTFSKMLLTGKIKEQYRLLAKYDITDRLNT